MSEAERLYEKLGCVGYYGFGTGYACQPEGPGYCNSCVVGPKCWDLHRKRVRARFPKVCAVIDAWPERGAAYCARIQAEMEGMDPYLAVFLGNASDGASINVSGKPHDRGDHTLTWPLEHLSEP